jgi:hypothetical protein
VTLLSATVFVVAFDSFVLGASLITGDSYRDWLWWLVAALNVLLGVLVGRRFLNEDARPGVNGAGVTTNATGPRDESTI